MSEQQMTRRQVYAFVALADLPSPESVYFTDVATVRIDVGDNVDPTGWLLLFGGDPATVRRQRYDSESGLPRKHGFILSAGTFEWRGWRVHVAGFIDDGHGDPVAALGEQTVEQLQALTAGEVDPADEAEAAREAADESRFLHEHGLVDEALQ